MPARQYAVQSHCFRHFQDNAAVARMVRAIGLDRIELCADHADLVRPAAVAEAIKPFTDLGIGIPSIGVQTFAGADTERAYFESAATAGAGHISAHFQVGTFTAAIPRVQAWSREFKIKVGIHTHGGYQFGGSPDVLHHLIALGAPEIGLCMDTAWVQQLGPHHGDPVEWVADFAPHLTAIHFKDFLFEPNAQWRDAIIGKGNLNLPALLAALDATGFDGIPIIEYEADAEDPVPALARCVEAIRRRQSHSE